MLESRTLSIAIGKPWTQVYEAIWRPENFPQWASGLSKGSLEKDGTGWINRDSSALATLMLSSL